MGLLPQNPRDQKLLILALVMVGGAAVYQQMYWAPKNEELTIVAMRLDTLDSLNKIAKADVARGSATKMKQEAEEFARELEVLRNLDPLSLALNLEANVIIRDQSFNRDLSQRLEHMMRHQCRAVEAEEFARELEVLRHLVPTQNEVPSLLESISTAARRAGLELSDVQPDGVVNGDQFDTYRYRLGVTGPYHQVAAFLSNVGSLSRIVAPINLTVSPTSRTGELKPKKLEQFLDARFQVQTYVAHASEKPVLTSGRAGAP